MTTVKKKDPQKELIQTIRYALSTYASTEEIISASVNDMVNIVSEPTTNTVHEIIDSSFSEYVRPYTDLDIKQSDYSNFDELKQNKRRIVDTTKKWMCDTFKCPEEDIAYSQSRYVDKISYHFVVTTKKVNYVDLNTFMKQNTTELKQLYIDPVVYKNHNQKIRMINTSKEYKRTPKLPMNFKNDLSKHLITNVSDDMDIVKLHIKEPTDKVIKRQTPSTLKIITSSNKDIYNEVMISLFGKNVQYTIKDMDSVTYLNVFNTHHCKVCDKQHSRSDGTYVKVSMTYKRPVSVVIGCWKSGESLDITIKRSTGEICLFTGLGNEDEVKNAITNLYNILSSNDYEEYIPDKLPDVKVPYDVDVIIYELNRLKELSLDTFDFQLKKTMYIIKANQGIGKSTLVSKSINEQIKAHPDDYYLCIAPLRSLNMTLYDKLVDFTLYSHIKNDKNLIKENKLIITPDSLPKLIDDDGNFKPPPRVLWLDECKTLLSYITSGPLGSKRQDVIDMIKYYIKYSKYVIITDADCDTTMFEELSMIRDPSTMQFVHNTKTTLDKSVYVHYNEGIYNIIDDKLKNDKKMYISSDSKNTVDIVYEYITTHHPDKKVNKYTSKDGDKDDFINCNTEFIKYDVVICSPTVVIGLDFNVKHFHTVIGMYKNVSIGAREANQALGRVRHPIDNELYLYFDNIRCCQLSTNKEEICRTYHRNEDRYFKEEDKNNPLKNLIKKEVDKHGVRIFDKNDFTTQLILNNKVEHNNSKNNFEQLLLSYLYTAGNSIFLKRAPVGQSKTFYIKVKTELNETNISIKENKTSELIDAKLLDEEEFEQRKNNGDSDIELDKYIMYSTYGINDVKDFDNTEDSRDIHGIISDLRKDDTVRQFKNLKNYINNNTIKKQDLKHKEIIDNAYQYNIKDLMDVVGFDNLLDTKSVTFNSNDNIDVSNKLLDDIKINCGDSGRFYNNNKKTSKLVMGLLGRLLKRYYGIKLLKDETYVRIGVKKSRKVTYNINHDKLMLELVINKLNNEPLNMKYKDITNYLKKNKEIDKFVYTEFHNMEGKLSKYVKNNLIKKNVTEKEKETYYMFGDDE